MMAGFVQNCQFEHVFALSGELLRSRKESDAVIISSVMSACSNFSVTKSEEHIQGFALKIG